MPDCPFAGDFGMRIDAPVGITSFPLRQSPLAIPEPTTFTLVSLGLLGPSSYRRGGRRSGRT